MTYNTQAYCRPAANAIFEQQVQARKSTDVLGSINVWRAVGKICLFGLPVIFSLNLALGFYMDKIENSIRVAEDARFELMDKHIALRAENARLMSPDSIEVAAAEKLSLIVPEPGQVIKF